MVNATSILVRVCESEEDGTRFVEIRVDSRFSLSKTIEERMPDKIRK